MLHFLRRQELGLLDVDDRACLGHGDHQVGLARQEGRQLDDVADFGDHGSLRRLVDVGDQRHVEGLLDLFEDAHALFQAGATVGGHRRAVGLVEAGLEHVGDAELVGHPHVFFADLEGHVARFQHVHAAEQDEWLVVGDLDVANADDLLRHEGQAFF